MKKYSTLPSLSLLVSFESAARHESFTRAAEELGVTQGGVSRQVRELEKSLGVTLFRRVGRAVRLTDAGRAFFSEVTGDLAQLQRSVERAVGAGDSTSILTVAVLPTFAARWLVPRLPGFKAAFPGIELELRSYIEPFDLDADRIDIAIHFGKHDWPGARLEPLCPENLVVVAAPSLVAAYKLADAQNVFAAPLLHLSSRPGLWARFREQLGLPGESVFPGPRFDQFAMLISGSLAALGVSILPTYLIEDEIASGALTVLGPVHSDAEDQYHLATPAGSPQAHARAFSSWIRREVRGSGRVPRALDE